jgi:acetyl-CoA carboxylase biotin carboxyl carrier protein
MSNDEIFGIINYINSLSFSEFEMETGEIKIRIKRQGSISSAQNDEHQGVNASESPPNKSDDKLPKILAPISGVFYQAAAPGDKPFVSVGDMVNKGDTLCILEAMKMMNEVKSDRSGVIKEILVEDGKSVDESDPLFIFQGE